MIDDRKRKQEAIGYAKRRWKDTQELIDNIKGITDEFENDLMSSLVFEGLIFRAGAPSLQYNFLDEDWATHVRAFIAYDEESKLIHVFDSKISHEVLQIDGHKPYWTVPEYMSDTLDPQTPYFLYIRASKNLRVDSQGRMVGEAEFFISDKKIKLEDEDGNYIFWVAFLNSENEENERSIRTMYGFTELLPGQITADTLISSDGNSYMDFLLNKFKIGNKNSSLDWNVSKDEQLSIKNANFEINNSMEEAVAKIDGETGTVEFGKGSSIFENDGSARMANNNLYWDKNGNITMLGNFQGEVSSTDLEGNKIVINAMNKSIRLYTSENDLMGYISYSTESNEISDWKLWEARMGLRMYERLNGTKWKSTELILSPIGIRHFKYNSDGSIADSASWPQ